MRAALLSLLLLEPFLTACEDGPTRQETKTVAAKIIEPGGYLVPTRHLLVAKDASFCWVTAPKYAVTEVGETWECEWKCDWKPCP